MSDEEDDFCFGQREPPLVDYVKQILRNYTEGQLLKELTQNADDARATTVKFLYDSRQHSTDRLYCGEGIGDLSPYQGPALCAFNDATFVKNDWTSIQNLSRSEKKDDPTKVGRFGMGFVSVYHVTDMPSILSGNYLAFMDPSETLFKYDGRVQRGRQVHKRSDIFKEPKFAGQFTPYKNLFEGHPGLIEGQSFDGAMFRFPLRSRSSVISENVIDGDEVRNLLDLFVDDAKILLLFLNNVSSITVGERLAEREESLFSATISSQTKDIVQKSREDIITNSIENNGRLKNNECQTFSTIFPMNIEIKGHTMPTDYKWLLSIYLGGSDITSEMFTLATEYDRLPLVGVAMQVFSGYAPTLEGRTFCFLPLPPSENNSGLPVHVNADFCVSDDRRSIKWPVVDRSDKMSTWNRLLLQHLFPKAYVKLILGAIEQYGTGEDNVSVECVYQTWPDMEHVRFPWKELMCPELFNMLLKEDVFFSEIGNSRWININNAVFDDVEIPEETRELLVRLLLENNVPIVSTRNYPHVMNAVKMYRNNMDIVFITPRLARDKLRKVSLGSLTSKEKIVLLDYLLGDDDFADLHGFELLPLADGSFCEFASSRGNNTVFYSVSNECSMDLLPGLSNIFIDDGLGGSLQKRIIDGSKKTGINQVQELKPNMISSLIKDALPDDWLTRPDVIWYPGKNVHPPQSWLEKFWNFLQYVCKDPECDIREYEGITLIPTNFSQDLTQIKLVQLKRNSHIVVSSQYSPLDSRLGEILPLLHLITVNIENADFVKFPPNIQNRYFHRADPNDILRIFDEAGTLRRLQNDIGSLSTDHIQLLRAWLKDVRDMKYSERNILVNIAVFQKATHVLGSSNHMFQSAIANNNELRAVSKDDLPADGFLTEEILLDISDEDSRNLASKLCLKQCPREDVLCQMVRCTLRDNGNLASLVIWIMERWDEFHYKQKMKIRYEIQDKPFIPLQNGSLKRASECFDPSDKLLTKLFSGHCDIFPTPPFGTKYLSILQEFGLKTHSEVTTDDVRRCVAEITSASDVEKGYALLELLEENPKKFLTDIHYLQHQQWVPVEEVIDSNVYPSGFPLFNKGHNLVSPKDAKSALCAPLVGSTLPLVSNRFHMLSKRFEWESNFQPDKIYLHLLNIVKYVSEQNKMGNKVDTPRIERILHKIYKYMQDNLEDFKSFTANEDKLVWTGQSFIAPTKVSIQKTRHSLEPYVFTLHPGFSGYKKLFRKFGAIKKYDETAKSMLCLFEEIKTFHETPGYVAYERIDHDRDLAIQVIECIIDLNKENLTDEVRERIFLPVAAPNEDGLQFAACDDVCFPNEEWLEVDEFDDIKLVHEKVSRKIYNCLGVIPLGQKISGAMSLLGFQQAGQKEDLTQKLRNILDSGYTEDSIANEMIQNADDAGATEVKFMVDMRRNSAFNSKLLDKGMKAWHGPALWVYNNATFSNADFENITKIGGRTKESKQEQIGTFGLGFNSVYHITDVPSFLSRGLIGFLDPHTEFLDSQLRDKRNPGIRIDLNRSKTTLKRFENQFKPYQGIFDCNIFDTNEVNLDGTLFRLPLRLRSIDIKSQISDKCFEEDDIMRLMQNVMEMSEKLLLFTQHVTQISVHYLGDQQEPQHAVQLFSVTKRPKQYMKEINKLLKGQRGKKKFEMQNCILHAASQFLLNKSKTNATKYPSSLTKLSIEHCLTQEGALRFRTTSAEHFTKEWIVLSSMGQSEALDLYKSDTSCYKIPCGGVALPVRSNLKQGEVFCFLPLSIQTSGIPCHINGNFEVANDRRSLWKRGTLFGVKDIKSDWNDAIFSDIITRSYVSLLRHKEAQSCLVTDSIYDLWPNEMQIPDQSEYFPLLKAFYRSIAHGIDNLGDKPCVFNSNNKWLNIDSIVIYKPDNHAIADDVQKVLQRFISPGMYVIDVPDKVVNGFNRAGCGDYIQQKIYTEERFFKEMFFPNITKIENEIRNKLTMHAIDHYKRPLYRQLLESTACIPTDNTSTRLEKISAVVHPHGKVADLFEPEENRFPTASFQMDDSRMEVMVKLGMIKDDMTLPELLERAKDFEKSKHQRQHKIKKIQCFMNFLETKQRIINKKFIDALLCIQILPVLKRPSFPSNFPWYGDECGDFLCAEDLYPADYDLVCFVKPIIDEVVFQHCQDTESVRRIFNLSKQMRTPSCQDVIQQLKKLAGIQNEYLVANESTVLRLCKKIYSNLEGRLHDSSNDDIDELSNDKWPWVWNGEGFSYTSSVCVNEGSVDLRPYHFSVHRSLRSHQKLLQHCNVAMKPSEQLSDLIRILHKIKAKHDTVGLTADIERDRHLVIGILTYIKIHTNDDMMEHLQDILIPIEGEELRMVTPDECCFCDDWFKRSLDVEHKENLVHQDVTNTTAEFFGVIPLSRKLSHSHEIGITQWGQEEPLTQRLRNILQDYQAIDIPKEMIQNADDAEASEVKFLIDLSTNSNTKGLLDKGMALCHGPALCVFNDAMFTDDDFENITKLGGQTKRKQTEKIGKFGLGFNSVYHLTDVPSFISNGRLTIFDPHRFHLGNQLKSGAPGIKINFRDEPTTLVRFSNQFQPYNNLFGCDLHCDSFTGTLFRLPLRTNKQVQEGGKISKHTFGNKEITELITRFCKQAGEMLIFTKHVQRMSIYRRKSYEKEPDCICNVVKEVLGESNGSMYKIRITVEFPNSDVQLNENSKQDWFIQPVQGANDALNIARSPEGVKHGLNACGGLAYKCDNDEIAAGLVFCFLPLSIPSSNLPVHINAKFSVAPDRRSLRKKGSGDYTTMHSEWNNALMKDVIARGYVTMLSEPTKRSLLLNDVLNNHKKDGLFSIWPLTDQVHTDVLHVVYSFYQAIVHGIKGETDLPQILNVDQDWYTFNDVCFLDAELTDCHILPVVKDVMIINGFVVVDLPGYIRKSFIDSNCSNELKKKTVLYRKFFEEQFFAKLTELPDDLANEVVLYLLQHSKSDWIDELLKCTPCIPSTPDGARKLPSDLIDQSSHIISSMYLPEDGKFPLGNEFTVEEISGKLRSLGMSHSIVPLGYVVERCQSIEIIHQTCCLNESIKICQQRADAILWYIDSIKSTGVDTNDTELQEIQNIKFMPTETQAPKNYPVVWAKSVASFSSPNSVYNSDLVECVGAVAPIAKQLSCSRLTKKLLKMKLKPDLMHVLKQLEYLVATDCTDIDRVQRMYKHLMQEIQQNLKTREEAIKGSLQNLEVVLCSGNFMKIEHVALRCNRKFVPYLYQLPVELEMYRDVFKILGIKEYFHYSTLLDICYCLKKRYHRKPLGHTDLEVAIGLVHSLADSKYCDNDKRQILVPDKQGCLMSVDKLSFCLHACSDDNIEGEILCHDLIPHKVAATLGIKDIRSSILSKNGIKLNIAGECGTRFGQVQSLTSRIGEILKGYPCDDSIFKELLQNSDDAGAEEINFIHDPHRHQGKNIFCESWKETLGPALCVFNNRPFTEDDLKGIQDLGTGSKSIHPDKTGQYGIGFNSVYHLTDCPSFLTNDDTVCIFDPHCAFIDHATPDSPGYQYNITPKLNNMFRDALSCFRLESLENKGCTMFRFPLRTTEMSTYAKSKDEASLSEEIFDERKLQTLLEQFKSKALDMLLYLNNLTNITISHIDEDRQLKTDYWVKAELSPEDGKTRREFYNYVKECAKRSKLTEIKMKEATYEMKISDMSGKTQVWLVNQRIGSTSEIQESISSAYNEGYLKLLPRGGVAACISQELTSHCAYCFLPLPINPNLPVNINGHFSLDSSRQNLSNISQNSDWNSYVKCEVIAHSYSQLLEHLRDKMFRSVRGSKSQITCTSQELNDKMERYWRYFPNIQKNVHSEWQQLAEHVFLIVLRNKIPLFPVVRRTDDVITNKSKKSKGINYSLEWLPAIEITGRKAYFYMKNMSQPSVSEVKLSEDTKKESKKKFVKPILQQIGFKIVNVPNHIYRDLTNAELLLNPDINASKCQSHEVEMVSPHAVVHFLKTDFEPGPLPCDITRSPLQSELNYLALLEYIDKDWELREGKIPLDGMPLLLTQDSCLRRFNTTNAYFHSKKHTLLPICFHEFVHEDAYSHFSTKSDGIIPFRIADLVERLNLNLDQQFNGICKVAWDPKGKEIPNQTWIQELWDFLKGECENHKCFPNMKGEERFANIKRLMGNWAVLPVNVKIQLGVQNKVNHYLMPFSLADSVLHSSIPDSYLKDALCKMALAVVDDSIFPRKKQFCALLNTTQSDMIDLITRFVATESTPDRILTSLVSLLDENDRAFDVLDESEDKKNILLFFERFIESSLNEQHIGSLRRLPCYQSIHHEFISLNHNKQQFVLHSGIPEVEKEQWVTDTEAAFIKDDPSLKKLHALLGLTKCTEPDVYKRFILPSFHKFTRKGRIEHMQRIKFTLQHTMTDRSKTNMVSFMKSIPLVSHEGQPLKKILEYFDSVPIFKHMLEPDKFLPEPFGEADWKQLMKELGLQTKPTEKQLLEFAHTIEQEMKYDFEEQTEKSKELINYISNSEELKTDVMFLSELRSIAFLVPCLLDSNLLTLHKPFTEQGIGIAYDGALTHFNVHLVWTSANILQTYAHPRLLESLFSKKRTRLNDILLKLNVSDQPSLDVVLKHTKNICTHLKEEYSQSKRSGSGATSSKCQAALHKVMDNIYKFISKLCRENSEQVKKELVDVPIMLVDDDRILIEAKYTVKTLKKGIVLTPYIRQIPECFVQYMDLFSRLGAQEKTSIWQCCELLKIIHEDIKDDVIENPNVMSVITFAVRKIFKSYQEKDWLKDISVLYLPNRSCQLVESSTLKYYDEPMFEVRMKAENDKNILFDLNEIRLDNAATDFIENMPTKLKPCKFSKQVKEIMTSNQEESKCRYAKEGLCKQLKVIRNKVQSKQFRHGIYRLLKHEANQKGVELPETVLSNVPQLSQEHLSIECLNKLETHLERSDKRIEGSMFKRHCFLQRLGDHVTIFIKHSEKFDLLKLKLTNIICELTGVLDHMIVAMMISSELSEIQMLLSSHNIQTVDVNTSGSMSIPELGSPVPEDIVASLDNDPFNEFTPGEYVAYELDEQELFVYAKIIRNISGSKSINCIYEIDFGKVNREVSALNLYKWLPGNRNASETQHVEMALEMYIAPESREESVPEHHRPHQRASTPPLYENLEEAKEKLSDKLEEIWKLGEQERKKAVKRLYLKWHPDKNPGHEDFCSEVFKYLQNEIDRLEKGLPRQQSDGAGSSGDNCYSDFGRWEEPFRRWNQRAGSDKRKREYYDEFGSSSGERFGNGASFNSGTYPDFTSNNSPPPRPMSDQPRLWQSQALEDLRAAQNDINGYPSYEWVAHKCMQAAEKSIKAAILSSTGKSHMTHDIKWLSITVEVIPGCPGDLRKYVDELCVHGKDQDATRYPRQFDNEIPHNIYDREDADKCILNAKKILDMMDRLIVLNEH